MDTPTLLRDCLLLSSVFIYSLCMRKAETFVHAGFVCSLSVCYRAFHTQKHTETYINTHTHTHTHTHTEENSQLSQKHHNYMQAITIHSDLTETNVYKYLGHGCLCVNEIKST